MPKQRNACATWSDAVGRRRQSRLACKSLKPMLQDVHEHHIPSLSVLTLTQIFDRYFFLALAVSTSPIIILFNGAAGTNGNAVVTGLVLAGSIGALFLFSHWRDFVVRPCDILFAVLVSSIAVSFALNGLTDTKEEMLLALTLSAYPAGRLFSSGNGINSSFVWVTSAIVVVGTIVTAFALYHQWYDETGAKILVFGFAAAPTNFLTSLGFLIIASAIPKLTTRRTIIISALIFIPVVIYAASQVRFTFVAIIGSLIVGALVTQSTQRRHIIVIAVVIMTGVLSGLVARSATTAKFTNFIFQTSNEPTDKTRPPSCSMFVDHNNSIAIRKALARDALFLIPTSGPFGTGLNSFMALSCIGQYEVHNSFLQAIVEFGWIGGIAFVLLVALAGWRLVPMLENDEARFVLCCLVYVFLLDLAYGHVSRDISLFLFLGYASGLRVKSE
jgi:hypothetical protein